MGRWTPCGFLAKGDRADNLARVRELLRIAPEPEESADPATRSEEPEPGARQATFANCPDWGGLMRRIEIAAPGESLGMDRPLRTSTNKRRAKAACSTNSSPTCPNIDCARSSNATKCHRAKIPPSPAPSDSAKNEGIGEEADIFRVSIA